ncbi:toprim domain-containing protein [Neorhodopirellula lusitana]|uniref:toprim domain-containing protein n=1 Tax=Neorhodopirellula lusitana TaxID=445327 RepID=UPI00384EFDCA
MSQYRKAPVHYPCEMTGGGPKECFFVEGDSAAKSVSQVRDTSCQAVLALQGKPMNVLRASRKSVATNLVLTRVAETLLDPSSVGENSSPEWPDALNDSARCAYDRIVLLMDPDADGIHCGVLMMGFFQRFAPGLIASGRLLIVRPPMFVFRFAKSVAPKSNSVDQNCVVASSPEHARAVESVLKKRGLTSYRKTKHRGLASLDAPILSRFCVAPETRQANALTPDEIDSAVSMFSGGS